MLYVLSVFLFVAVVAAGNLYLGFATATALGRGPQRWARGFCRTKPNDDAIAPPPFGDWGASSASDALPSDALPKETDATEPPSKPAVSREWKEAVEDIRRHAGEHRDRLLDIDEKARLSSKNDDTEGITESATQCAAELVQAGRDYIKQQASNVSRIETLQKEHGDVGALGEGVKKQAERALQTTQKAVDQMDELDLTTAGLEDYCRQLLQETGDQIEHCQEYREALDDTLAQAQLRETAHDADDGDVAEEEEDEMTRLGRELGVRHSVALALKRTLARHTERGAATPLTLAAVDLDEFSSVNDRHGHKVADRILCQFEELVTCLARDGGEAHPASGQQYWIAFDGIAEAEAIVAIERVRQTMERTRFQHQGGGIRVTVSAAVVEASEGADPRTMGKRLLGLVQEAKRLGRNRTLQLDGALPVPVPVPAPNLGVETKVIMV